jgi:diguanylate cyclase (GGDEF)-like protein
MALRTRIAVTFLLLLAAVLGAALYAVSAANRSNAEREVQRQLDVGASVFTRFLESNRRLLTQAAQAVAADYGFREAVSARDTNSALENSGARVGAALVVLTSLDGRVIAAFGSHAAAGSVFEMTAGQHRGMSADHATRVMVDGGKIYEMVTVAVRSPVPVAWITMGFELDDKAARELADITGLGVTLSLRSGDAWSDVATTLPAGAARRQDVAARRIPLADLGDVEVEATLSRSLTEARAPFERLTNMLFIIAGFSLIGFAWAAFGIARNITRPLQNLTASVDRIRGGAYDVELAVHRRDELGVLAQGLMHMQTAVQSRDQSIRRLAYEDTLTGLMNRTAFQSALNQTLSNQEQSKESGGMVAVAVVNLLRFRRINEHLGYSVGDEVLITIASRLAALPSVNSAVARLAADEFAAFTRLPDAAALQPWATSLLVALSEPVAVESQPIDISATVGVALGAGTTLRAEELLRRADMAVEQARREKHPLAIYQEAISPAAREQLSLLGELRHAVEHDELRLYYQPKIELATNRVSGAEVLMRWQHPTRGLLSPAAFIPFAEQTGFIRRLTRWALDRAIAQGAAWHRAGRPLSLAVNISADDIDLRLDSRIAALLTRHQLPPSLLTIELTESGFIGDPERALRILTALSALGVNLSIDDFGTGYSSLSLLVRMPVHEMKIDRSFILGLESDAEYTPMVRSAIDMAHSLGLRVVAEGIENTVTAERLRDFRCDIGQGYLYARPMAAEEFSRWMEGRERVPVVAAPVDFNVQEMADTTTLLTY